SRRSDVTCRSAMAAEPKVSSAPAVGAREGGLRSALGAVRAPRTRAWLIPATAALAALALTASVLAWAGHDRPILHIEAAFGASACCSLTIGVNGTDPGDVTIISIAAGRDATYTVPLYTPHVGEVAMAVGQTAGASVAIRRIWITRGSRTVTSL